MSLLGECLGRALNQADKTASAQDGSMDYLGESRKVSGCHCMGRCDLAQNRGGTFLKDLVGSGRKLCSLCLWWETIPGF